MGSIHRKSCMRALLLAVLTVAVVSVAPQEPAGTTAPPDFFSPSPKREPAAVLPAAKVDKDDVDLFAAEYASNPCPNDNVCVAVTGAAGQIAYALLPLIMEGRVFGKKRRVRLQLLDIANCADALEGVAMEIRDCYCDVVSEVIVTTDPRVAFQGAHVAILLGGFPRLPSMERRDLIAKNVPIMAEHGKALADCASKYVRVLVVANPACTNCLVASTCAPSIPKSQFSSLSRLDHDRLSAMLAKEMHAQIPEVLRRQLWDKAQRRGKRTAQLNTQQAMEGEAGDVLRIRNVCLWGNHSPTMWPDITKAEAKIMDEWFSVEQLLDSGENGFPLHDPSMARERGRERFAREFVPTIRARGSKVIELRGKSSALSAANAIANHLRDWLSVLPARVLGDEGERKTRGGEFARCKSRVLSMGVSSDGNPYNVPEGLFFSFPVDCSEGRHRIVETFSPDQDMLQASTAELLDEKKEAFDVLENSVPATTAP